MQDSTRRQCALTPRIAGLNAIFDKSTIWDSGFDEGFLTVHAPSLCAIACLADDKELASLAAQKDAPYEDLAFCACAGNDAPEPDEEGWYAFECKGSYAHALKHLALFFFQNLPFAHDPALLWQKAKESGVDFDEREFHDHIAILLGRFPGIASLIQETKDLTPEKLGLDPILARQADPACNMALFAALTCTNERLIYVFESALQQWVKEAGGHGICKLPSIPDEDDLPEDRICFFFCLPQKPALLQEQAFSLRIAGYTEGLCAVPRYEF